MIKIFLCEDNLDELKTWGQIITDYLEISGENAALEYRANTPSGLLDYLERVPPQTGLYFLDINFPDNINGLQLAAKIRLFDPRGYIVFITSHSEMSYMTFQYKVEAMDFILKDSMDEKPQKIRNCIKTAIANHENLKVQKKDILTIKAGNQHLIIESDDIICIETSPNSVHKLSIYTLNGIKSVYATLKEFEYKLAVQPQFIRCYKSAIINRNHIQSIDRKTRKITLSTGKECPFSTGCFKKLLEKNY